VDEERERPEQEFDGVFVGFTAVEEGEALDEGGALAGCVRLERRFLLAGRVEEVFRRGPVRVNLATVCSLGNEEDDLGRVGFSPTYRTWKRVIPEEALLRRKWLQSKTAISSSCPPSFSQQLLG